MSIPIEGLPRRVIPRWRDFRTAAELGELSTGRSSAARPKIPSALQSLLRLWKTHQSEIIAGELLSASWLERCWETAAEAAKYLLRRGSSAQELTKNFARTIIEDIENEQNAVRIPVLDRAAVQSIRSALRLYPRDAMGRCEISGIIRLSVNWKKPGGQSRLLSPSRPTIGILFSSVSRCFVHLGEPDLALRILRSAIAGKSDPWLVAAHLSIAQITGKTGRLYKEARGVSEIQVIFAVPSRGTQSCIRDGRYFRLQAGKTGAKCWKPR